jgi:hypothetical protein
VLNHIVDEATAQHALQSLDRLTTGSGICCKQLRARYNPSRVFAPFCSLAFRPKHTGHMGSPHQGSSIAASPR